MKPPRNDLLLALAVTVLAALEVLLNPSVTPKWAAAVTELPFAFALAWRRRFPILVVATVSLGLGLEASLGVPVNQPVVSLLVIVIAVFSVSVNEPLRRSVLGAAMILPGSLSGWSTSAVTRSSGSATSRSARSSSAGYGWRGGSFARGRGRQVNLRERPTVWSPSG